MNREEIYTTALLRIKIHTEILTGPKLCLTNTVWLMASEALDGLVPNAARHWKQLLDTVTEENRNQKEQIIDLQRLLDYQLRENTLLNKKLHFGERPNRKPAAKKRA